MYISFKRTLSRIKYVYWRLCQYMRHAPAAPTTPSVTLDHRQASPGPPGAASGTHNAPNGVDLAQTRSHRREVLKRALARRPPRGTAGRRRRLARPTHAAHAAGSGSALASCRCTRAAADSGPVRAHGGLHGGPNGHAAAALR